MWPSLLLDSPVNVSSSAILHLQTQYMNKCSKSSLFAEKKPLTPSGLYSTFLLEFGHGKFCLLSFSFETTDTIKL